MLLFVTPAVRCEECGDYLLQHFPPFVVNPFIGQSCPAVPLPPLVTICLPYRIDYRLFNGCHVAHAHA